MATEVEKRLETTKKLYLLVTIAKKTKAEYYVDLLNGFDANLQILCIGNGTTKSALFTDEIGSKVVIFSVLTEEKAKKAIKVIDEKFAEIREGKGVAFTVPISSVMGVTFFNFLSNNKTKFD